MRNILVVEDDPTVLMSLEEGLGDRGFSVLSARSSGEALNILGGDMFPVDALVVDIRLGDGIDGWEIARCSRDLKADLPIVYVTGDSFAAFGKEAVPCSLILQKPFSLAELSEAINSLLCPDSVAPDQPA